MYPSRTPAQLLNFFAGLAEYVFHTQMGVADPPLVTYMSELLARFVRFEAIYGVRNLTGRRLEEVGQMLAEAEQRLGEARREVHRHIGDFTLFWTGVYPEALRRLQAASRSDRFLDYCQQGKRSYYIASTIRTAENQDECSLLERISHEYELCMYGLSEIRREWERSEADGPPPQGPLLLD